MAMAQEDRTAPAGGESVPDRAVVLVHGIGSQQRGTVLSGWVQAILGWVEDTEGLRAQIDRVHTDDDGPAWADVVLGHPAGIDTVTTRVRLYEAFWADVIRPPSFTTLVRWSASILPKVISHHLLSLVMVWPEQSLADLADDGWATRLRGVMRAVATVVLLPVMLLALTFGAAAGLLAVAAVWVLGLVALVPVLRGPAKALQKVVATSVGDTAYITTNDMQRAYVVDRVKQAIGAAIHDVGPDAPITVLAHSQGAAVTYYALTEGTPPSRPVDLVTFGQGLTKVERIRVPLRDAWFVTIPYLMSAVTGVAGWWVIRRDAVDGLPEAAEVVLLGLVPLTATALLVLLGRWLWSLESVQPLLRRMGRALGGDPSDDVDRLASSVRPWLHAGLGWLLAGLAAVVAGWWQLIGAMAMDVDRSAVALVGLVGVAMFVGAIQLWRHARTPAVAWAPGLTGAAATTAEQRANTARSHGLRVHLSWPSTLRTWTDLWATSDPVPGGALRTPAGAPAGAFSSRGVVNRQSILGDHTSYWANRHDFVTTVVAMLLPADWTLRAGNRDAGEEGQALRRGYGLFNWYARVLGYSAFLAYGLFGPPIPVALPVGWIPAGVRDRVVEWTAMSAGRLESLVVVGVAVAVFRLVTTWASGRAIDRRWAPTVTVDVLAAQTGPLVDAAPDVDGAGDPNEVGMADGVEMADAEQMTDEVEVSDEVPAMATAMEAGSQPTVEESQAPAPAAGEDLEVVFYLDGTPVYSTRKD